ncbi:hypothetical protein [Azospirillum sp.]|uniref:hypothetical protein n=1 Tax=Azospirillum sp. TaxID=34012 RepID=UPI003D72AF90
MSAAPSPAAGPPRRPASEPEADQGVPLDTVEFRHKARQILQTHSSMAAGVVHLLGLDQIREAVGEKWPLISERVHDLAARMLQKHLGPNDAWIRYDNANYLVVFSGRDKAAAQLVCGKIKAELHELLLGRSETSTITVKTATIDLEGQVLVETQRLSELLDAFATQAAAAAECTGCTHRGEDAEPPCIGTGQELAQKLGLAGKSEPEFMYRPVWDAYAQVISTYVCEAFLVRPGFNRVRGYDVLYDQENFDDILDLDMKTFSEAVATYNELFQNRFRFVLTIPVHFETLANTKRRREYWQLFRMTPKYLIPFLAFELVSLPPKIPFGRLSEIVNILRTSCRTVIARTGSELPDLPTYVQGGVKAVGLDICAHADGAKVRQDIERFGAVCRKAGIVPYADGVRTPSMLEAADKAAFKYLAGPLIGEADSFPQHMARCSEREILMRARIKASHRVA